MPVNLEGKIFDDQLHRIGKTLFESELSDPMGLLPFLVVTQSIDTKRVFVLYKSALADDIEVHAPGGRAWKILQARLNFAADSNVADRACVVRTRVAAGSLIDIYSETVAADAFFDGSLGSAVSSANPGGGDKNIMQPTLVGEVYLQLTATNKEAGDVWFIRAVIEETVSYGV